MSHKLFVSLPIKNLDRSVTFFKALGFTFNPKFTGEQAACMLIGEHAYAMLLVESFFKTFTKKAICDTATHVDGAYGLSCESRAEVEAVWTKALAGGGKDGGPPEDHGFIQPELRGPRRAPLGGCVDGSRGRAVDGRRLTGPPTTRDRREEPALTGRPIKKTRTQQINK